MRTPDYRVWDIKKQRMVFFNAFETGGWIDHTKSNITMSTGSRELLISTHPKEFVWQQFTGLLDENKKKIYEGDKVRCHIDKHTGLKIGSIEWSPMASQWWIAFEEHRYKPLEPDYGDDNLYCQYVEVIGHVYESKLTHDQP
jgi:uncharacterized phage protein (TIGR01671 family)